MLKIGTLLCQLLQLTSESGAQLCLDMATTAAAQALGVGGHALKVGASCDAVLLRGGKV